MTIKVGDRVPKATFKILTTEGISDIDSEAYFKGRKVAIFGLPGAYTPVCSAHHLPGYVEQADALRARGFAEIACIAVNDPFVMDAWGKDHGAPGKVTMLADHDGAFARGAGLVVSLPAFGLGERSERYAMVVEDGIVRRLEVENSVLDHELTSAACMLRN